MQGAERDATLAVEESFNVVIRVKRALLEQGAMPRANLRPRPHLETLPRHENDDLRGHLYLQPHALDD